ncbi:hypothetical protein TWF506_009623 [Arthrobotrys conoides]|uniref:Uncharacterized protein n=1 Tax=Arthrobotrys conoides TaxID=74498 RepID=A0AAN8PCQ4_9PEZI
MICHMFLTRTYILLLVISLQFIRCSQGIPSGHGASSEDSTDPGKTSVDNSTTTSLSPPIGTIPSALPATKPKNRTESTSNQLSPRKGGGAFNGRVSVTCAPPAFTMSTPEEEYRNRNLEGKYRGELLDWTKMIRERGQYGAETYLRSHTNECKKCKCKLLERVSRAGTWELVPNGPRACEDEQTALGCQIIFGNIVPPPFKETFASSSPSHKLAIGILANPANADCSCRVVLSDLKSAETILGNPRLRHISEDETARARDRNLLYHLQMHRPGPSSRRFAPDGTELFSLGGPEWLDANARGEDSNGIEDDQPMRSDILPPQPDYNAPPDLGGTEPEPEAPPPLERAFYNEWSRLPLYHSYNSKRSIETKPEDGDREMSHTDTSQRDPPSESG